VAGLVLAARLGSGYTGAGAGFELNSIVAVVLGGTALSGGRGGVLGTLAGVLLLALIANMLNLMGISPFTQRVINGLIIIAAIAIYTARRRES
jgi:ribose transport system permease protein